jgi:hypothetical protein
MGWVKPATVWWNRIKKNWLLVLGSLILLFLVFVFVMMLTRPRIGNTFCTMAGCLGSFGIVVEGLPNGTVYDLDIQYLRGHEQNLTCEIGKSESQASPLVNGCVPDGALFTLDMDERPPEEVTVTVTIDGKKVSKVFYPTYDHQWRPNGEDCPPVCYSSTIVMDVSE